MAEPIRYLSLFSGIGGFELGIKAVFPDAQCVGYSEISEPALTVYREHFPHHQALGDVTHVDFKPFLGRGSRRGWVALPRPVDDAHTISSQGRRWHGGQEVAPLPRFCALHRRMQA